MMSVDSGVCISDHTMAEVCRVTDINAPTTPCGSLLAYLLNRGHRGHIFDRAEQLLRHGAVTDDAVFCLKSLDPSIIQLFFHFTGDRGFVWELLDFYKQDEGVLAMLVCHFRSRISAFMNAACFTVADLHLIIFSYIPLL